MNSLGASVITMDHLNFYQEIKILDEVGGIDYLHIDIMDGHFVPRYGIYPEIVGEISRRSNFKLDVHLMVTNVEFAISQLESFTNIETISFHYSTNEGRVFKIVDAIKNMGALPILAIDLSTSITAVSELLESNELSGVLFMGIHPGVLQQVHRPQNVIHRLECLNEINRFNPDLVIQVDGGFNFDTAQDLSRAGINSFVGGSSSIYFGVKSTDKTDFKVKKIKSNIECIQNRIKI